ncbi:MAG TPA: RluA family pseudouridine synthase [Vicinamibacterales bacterium]|nr:RluA family pseudouridine synthase [Vicinamibacterales bacterium]
MSKLPFVVGPADAGLRLDKFLAGEDRLGSRRRASVALERGKVFVNDVEATLEDGGRRLEDGDRVRIWMDRPGSAHRRHSRGGKEGDLSIVYEDDVLVVLNKPPGLLSVPLASRGNAASVEDELVEHLRSHGNHRPLVVHRIDRDTSGLVVFAKRGDVQLRLKDQFRRREPERIYLAIVHGHLTPPKGTWRDRIAWDARLLLQKPAHPREVKAAEAVSRYQVLEQFEEASLIEVSLVTGKRNQIRLQARLHGNDLVGERLYVDPDRRGHRIEFERQALHAAKLVFRHPLSGQVMKFEAPVPADFSALLQNLRGKGRTVLTGNVSKGVKGTP